MFAKRTASSAVAIALLALAGCATYPANDPALSDARMSLNAARANPQVATYAPAEFSQAAATLRQADDLAANGGRYDDVHQLAVLAGQRAVNAQAVARTRAEQAAIVAQNTAANARVQAAASQQQAAAAQMQAAEAQRQADNAQMLAAAAPAPAYAPAYDYRRRGNEQLFEAPVTSVRAVVGPPQQRCWVERHVVATDYPSINVPGAVIGGVVGGILGHQIGSGRGQDLATGIGAVGGAVVGANVPSGATHTEDVQRCTTVASAPSLDYWDVTYDFRGYEHHMQTTIAPGSTVWVNAQGDPRV